MDWFAEMKRITRAYLEIHGLPVPKSLKDAEDDDPEQYADEQEEFDEERAVARREGDYRKTGDTG